MHDLIQLGVDGVLIGMLYALLAMGFVLVVKGSGVINFAHGELVLVGAYVSSWTMSDIGISPWLGLPLAMIICAGIGMVIERVALRPLINESMLALVMATIALGAILRGGTALVWPEQSREPVGVLPEGKYEILGFNVSALTVWAAVGALVLLVMVGAFFSWTKLGLAMQAVADDRVAAQSLGINLRAVNATSWALAGAVASVAGFVWGARIGIDGNLIVLGALIFPVVILGGLESMLGVVFGGIVVGVVGSLSAGYLDASLGGGFSSVSPLILLIVVLLVRPYGLFGRPDIERV